MSKTPWILTREMFLNDAEAASLLLQLAERTAGLRGPERDEALRDQVVIASLMLSGLRNSEFCRLTFGDVDLSSKNLSFLVQEGRGKARRVALPRSLGKLLRDYVGALRTRSQNGSSLAPETPFFLNSSGKPFDRNTLYRRVVRILTTLGLGERASVQLLRHTYGYLAYKRTGGNLLFAQRQLGHAHPMVTAIYEQFVDEDYSALADRIEPSSDISGS